MKFAIIKAIQSLVEVAMLESVNQLPTNPQELEQAIQQYRISDLTGLELFQFWQAIRDLSLEFVGREFETDRLPEEHSY
jgi:hypothetical protein